MRPTMLTILAVVIGLPLAVTAGLALELSPTPAEYLISYGTRTIDGDLSDWPRDDTVYVVDPTQAGPETGIQVMLTDPGIPLGGPTDLSARISLAWDHEYLYIGAAVSDDHLVGIPQGSAHNEGPPGWSCDSVMVHLGSFRQPLTTNSPYSRTPFLALRYEVPPGGRGQLFATDPQALYASAYWKLPEGSRFASRETPAGYQVEAAVPWAAFDFHPQAGEILFIGFLVADVDPGEPLIQVGWHYSGKLQEQAVFRLLERPEGTGLLTLSTSTPLAGSRLPVSYRVDARKAEVALQELVLVGPGDRRQSVPLQGRVPVGQTGRELRVIERLPDQAGDYRAQLVGRIGNQDVVLAEEQFTILTGPPPTPVVANPPGDLRRYRPGRSAQHAWLDFRQGLVRHGFVNDRSGYERYLLTHVKDYVDKNMEASLQRKDRWISEQIIWSYTLLRLTQDPRYADYVRRGIELAIENLKQDSEETHLRGLTEVRYFVWLHEPDTPLAPPNAEQDFQELWARAASEVKDWYFTEWGYHNRCWHRLGTMKIAKHFAEQLGRPVDPRIDEYIAFHDPLHDKFGMANDNATGYYWVGFRYPVAWHMAFDQLPELGQHQGWMEAVNTWRRYSSPSGAVPNFGDGNGWGTGMGEAMWAYEMLGSLAREGRLRWQAHRIAEYYYNHMWPRPDQYHSVRDSAAGAFCRAWLFADDSVAPVSVEPQSEVTFRPRMVEIPAEEREARPGLAWGMLTDERVPDKLVLSSGTDGQALWGLVELLDSGGHSGVLPGHIAALMIRDSALLAGQGYYEKTAEFSNLMWIEDMEGVAADPRPLRVEVPVFVEDAAVTWARIRVPRFEQMPVTYERDIVFVKNGFVLVRDRVTFHAAMKVRVGPCWQTREVGPQIGTDWFNTYYDHLYHTGLGLGRGVHEWPNPAWDLLIRFAPRPDTQITVLDRWEDNPWRQSPTQLRQSWSGLVEPGMTRTFTTVLLPHGPALDVTEYADWVQFLVEDDDTTLIRVRTENDNLNRIQQVYWVLLQEEAKPVEAEGFRSDARFAVIPIDPTGQPRPAVLVDGTRLQLDRDDLAPGARKPEARGVFVVEGE